jgi:hypothetical protein
VAIIREEWPARYDKYAQEHVSVSIVAALKRKLQTRAIATPKMRLFLKEPFLHALLDERVFLART